MSGSARQFWQKHSISAASKEYQAKSDEAPQLGPLVMPTAENPEPDAQDIKYSNVPDTPGVARDATSILPQMA